MKKTLLLVLAFLVFSSHDMFLKLDSYFLAPNSTASIKLFNGTFDKSENVIARNRMLDVSLLSHGKRVKLDTTQWFEKDSMTILNITTGEEGTYVAGVSTKARNIEMEAEAFNSYLEHDGILDMIEWRKSNNAMDQNAVEKYSKHVKTIVQVGNRKTNDWKTVLGYPIEFIPLSNPYESFTGDELQVQLLSNGKPLVNQLVYVDSQASANGHSHAPAPTEEHEHGDSKEDGHSHDGGHEHGEEAGHEHDDTEGHSHTHGESAEHSHDDAEGHTHEHEDLDEHVHSEDEAHEHGSEDHTHMSGSQLRTNNEGIVSVKLNADGIWYLRTINLVLSEEPGLTHESNWATLTFEVGHDHASPVEAHVHDEETPFGIPSYAYWLGSFALVGILFFFFYRNSTNESK